MRLWIATVLLGCFAPAVAEAGQIYGNVREGNMPVAGMQIEIVCGDARFGGGTDPSGSYTVFVPPRGRCTLALAGHPQRPEAVVYSYEEPVRYDFELALEGDRPVLRRR